MKKPVTDTGVQAKSDRLTNCRIAVGVCGGIAAVEVVKVIRELRRHGASVTAFLTPSVPKFIGPLSIEWAAGNPIVGEPGPDVDHLDGFDMVVVAPATLNTISKCALGIADNAVTLLVAGQLGRKAPLLLVPTMNTQLQNHPLFPVYLETLKQWGAVFLVSAVEEDRLKMPAPEVIAAKVVECLK